MRVRRTRVDINYNGANISANITPFLLSFSYTDNASEQADDIQIDLEDIKGLWIGSWYPDKGATLDVMIFDELENKTRRLDCGSFEVDGVQCTGPPAKATIKAVSIPSGGARSNKRSRAWENITLKQIASDMASKNGLGLIYESSHNQGYDRIDQVRKSDLKFLHELCKEEGLALKITSKKIVIFDEEKYEANNSVRNIEKGQDYILSYDFSTESQDTYSEAEVTYNDPNTKETVKGNYKPTSGPDNGNTLKVNKKASNKAEADRKAKKELRDKNKKEFVGKISLTGDTRLLASCVVDVVGFGKFDGRYIIEKATHKVDGSGYVTDIEIRKCLEGY